EFTPVSVALNGQSAMPPNELPTRLKSDRLGLFTRRQIMFCLAKHPGIAHRRSPNHHATHIGIRAVALHIEPSCDIPIANNWDRHGVGTFANHVPVCLAAVTLRTCATMNGDGLNATILQRSS